MFHVKQLKVQVEYLENCPLCQTQRFEKVLTGNDYLTFFGEFSIVRCQECSLQFTNPRPDHLSITMCYPGSNYPSHNKSPESILDKAYYFVRQITLRRKLALVKSLVKRGAYLLDVGSGVGSFAKFMTKNGFHVSTVEPSPSARESIKEKEIRVFEDVASYSNAGVEVPDIITLWHVLEHQHNYLESLYQYNGLLEKNGFLIVAVPQFGSFDARYYKSNWAAYDLPRHLFHFSKQTLLASAQAAGFTLLKIKGMPFDSFYVSLLSEQISKNKFCPFRAPFIAIISNLLAFSKITPWSSQIFVFKKQA